MITRAKIEEMLKVAEKEYSSVMFLSDSKSFMKMKIAQAKIQLLTSLLAEDGGEVGEANDEEILSDMTYRSGARRVEQIRWYRKGFLDHKKLLSNSAPSNEASQHTKGDGV